MLHKGAGSLLLPLLRPRALRRCPLERARVCDHAGEYEQRPSPVHDWGRGKERQRVIVHVGVLWLAAGGTYGRTGC